MENLSDREAADAMRGRIDWQYALGLALTDPGFDHTVLSEFRPRLVTGDAGLLLLGRPWSHSGQGWGDGAVANDSGISWNHINLLGKYDFSDEKLQDTVGTKLGQMVLNESDFLRADVVTMGILVIDAFAILFEFGMRYLERKLVTWRGQSLTAPVMEPGQR